MNAHLSVCLAQTSQLSRKSKLAGSAVKGMRNVCLLRSLPGRLSVRPSLTRTGLRVSDLISSSTEAVVLFCGSDWRWPWRASHHAGQSPRIGSELRPLWG